MNIPHSLSFEKQLELFSSRGMTVTKRDEKKLEQISYYRIKEFARPIANITTNPDGTKGVRYDGISFSDVLTRFYQDKNLRIHLLHAIEKIEVSIKTKTSFILGDSCGAFGYLNFSNWCDKKNFNPFEIEERQFYFKKSLQKSINRSYSSDVKSKDNQNSEGFPTVWLAIDVLTFGELVRIVEVMSKKNKRKLASFYDCTSKQLISWLKCINFVRNMCAHNSNIIDIKLITSPICMYDWNEKLFQIEDKNGNFRPSNRLAIVLLIVHHLVNNINEQYGWRNIRRSIYAICGGAEKKAVMLGFSSLECAVKCIQ